MCHHVFSWIDVDICMIKFILCVNYSFSLHNLLSISPSEMEYGGTNSRFQVDDPIYHHSTTSSNPGASEIYFPLKDNDENNEALIHIQNLLWLILFYTHRILNITDIPKTKFSYLLPVKTCSNLEYLGVDHRIILK